MNSEEFNAHKKWMSRECNFGCPICDHHLWGDRTQSQLFKHIYKVADCREWSVNQSLHDRLNSLLCDIQSATKQKALVALNKKQIACPLMECRKSFRTLEGLRKHLLRGHGK